MITLLNYTLAFAAILLLVALGGCVSEHSGVINLGLEGIMVIGALGGALVMKFMPNVGGFGLFFCVLLASIVFGVIYSSLLAVACINLKADQTIVGTALNTLPSLSISMAIRVLSSNTRMRVFRVFCAKRILEI